MPHGLVSAAARRNISIFKSSVLKIIPIHYTLMYR